MAHVTKDRPRRHYGTLSRGAVAIAMLATLQLLAATAASAGSLWLMTGDFGTSDCSLFRSGSSTSSSIFPIDECSFRNNGMNLDVLTTTPYGARGYFEADAPPGITIQCAYIQHMTVNGLGPGWVAGDYWAGGGNRWSNGMAAYSSTNCSDLSTGFNSGYWGFQLECFGNPCQPSSGPNGTDVQVNGVQLRATETSGPSIVAVGSNNLWYQGGRYVRGGGWPVSFWSTDPSGVCALSAQVNLQAISAPPVQQITSRWHQCPDQGLPATIDTRTYVPTTGPLSLALDASNAAGVASHAGPETLQVDNIGPSVSPAPLNDPDLNIWVNHPVTVDANPGAGPSGLQSVACADGSTTTTGPSITVDGTGTHLVACTATDNTWSADEAAAGGASGHGATATRAIRVKIDETPPSLAFEPQNPADPTGLIVDTSDAQSGVASGSIQMRPTSGGTWTRLPTQFDGQHLLAHLNDAGLSGPYELQATSCDIAGNCATGTQGITLPMRLVSVSHVSFQRIADPLKAHWVRKRVRVDWRWAMVNRHGKRVRVKRGGHYVTIRVLKWRAQCERHSLKTSGGRWRVKTICRTPHIVTFTSKRVRFGRRATVHGILTTSQGVPIPGAQVRLLTAPDDGFNNFTEATAATTAPDGSWSVKLPAGPSRIIQAAYDGSPTIQPSTGQANIRVGASIKIVRADPTAVSWGDTVRFRARLRGGYLPPGGALVRLRIGYGNAVTTYGVKEHVAGNGAFWTSYTFGLGSPSTVLDYWFQECTLPMGDYPYAPACSGKVTIQVGG